MSNENENNEETKNIKIRKGSQSHKSAKITLPKDWAKESFAVTIGRTVTLGQLAQKVSRQRIARLYKADTKKRLGLAVGWLGVEGLRRLSKYVSVETQAVAVEPPVS